jgi:hypothetical protein
MNRRLQHIHIALILVFAMNIVACTGSKKMAHSETAMSSEFQPSKAELSTVLQNLSRSDLRSLRGKARVAFSAPGNSERGTAEFTADRKNMLAKVRNNVGIEGVQVVVDPDSVLLYYVIDKIAWKLSINDYETRPEILLRLPLNLLDMLKPEIDRENVESVEENDRFYKVHLRDSSEFIVDKNTLLPQHVRFGSDTPDRFTEFSYESYAQLNGISLPRRIQAVTTDRKNRIRFDITELEVNPVSGTTTLSIPASVPIYRLKNEL